MVRQALNNCKIEMEIINKTIKTLMEEAREDKEVIKNKMIDIIMEIRNQLLLMSRKKNQEIRITLLIVK